MKKESNVAVLGPEGTFTEMAAKKMYPEAQITYCDTENDIFDSVKDGETDYGVIAIENSLEGSVANTMGCLRSHKVYIVGEIVLDINLCLISKDDSTSIKKIISHPHALAQSANFIQENYPEAISVSSASTAAAVKDIADNQESEFGASAIGPKYAAEKYDLKIRRENVQDEQSTTRFIAISATPATGNKTSVIFAVKDEPGMLYKVLEVFAQRQVNLTKIESRPSRRKLGEYLFFMDFESEGSAEAVTQILKDISSFTTFLKELGSY